MLSSLKGPLNSSQMFLGISIKLANFAIYMLYILGNLIRFSGLLDTVAQTHNVFFSFSTLL